MVICTLYDAEQNLGLYNTMKPLDDICFHMNMDAHEINLVLIQLHPVKQSFSISTSFLKETFSSLSNENVVLNQYREKH